MTADECISALDDALADDGEDIVLRRTVGTGSSVINLDVVCRAKVNAVSAQEVAAGIAESDLRLILSPTQINDAQWPGGTPVAAPSAFNGDPSLPVPGDKVIVQNRLRNVAAPVDAQSIGGVTVRINLRVTG